MFNGSVFKTDVHLYWDGILSEAQKKNMTIIQVLVLSQISTDHIPTNVNSPDIPSVLNRGRPQYKANKSHDSCYKIASTRSLNKVLPIRLTKL